MFANPLELTASTLGFLNWICASDASAAHHGVDATTGKTYSQEINANISSVFNFPREDCTTTANGTPAGSLSLVPTVRTLSGGNTTAGSSLVTVTTGTGTGDAIRPGDVGAAVSGAGIPSGARIGNVVDQTSFTILVNGTPTGATATGSGVALTVDMTNE
jgi:hypothetical protein